MITSRQLQIYEAIRCLQRDNGYAPTLEEIKTACGISSKSVVYYDLLRLRENKLVKWKPNTPRTLRLTT